MHLRPRHAGAVDRRRAGAEDQADAAQREGAARHRYSAGYSALPLRALHLPQEMKEKIALFCDVDVEAVITARDVKSRLRSPAGVRRPGRGRDRPAPAAASTPRRATSRRWTAMLERMKNPARRSLASALVGKYVEYEDSYKSLKEALLHGGLAHQLKVNIHWIEAEGIDWPDCERQLRRLRRHPGARRLRQARHRRHAQRHPLRAREQGAVFRHLPRHADHGDRIRAQRLRPGGRRFHRVRSRHAAPRHLQAARTEGRRRTGRHHAPGRLALPAGRRQLRAPRPTERARSASATATATNSIANTKTV